MYVVQSTKYSVLIISELTIHKNATQSGSTILRKLHSAQ